MQINPPNNLPIVSGLPSQTQSPARVPKPAVAQTPVQGAPASERIGEVTTYQPRRRAPLFAQAMAEQHLPHNSQQALRTYRDVATGGEDAELVGRLSVKV